MLWHVSCRGNPWSLRMHRGKMGAMQQQLFWGGKVLPAVLLLFPEALHSCCWNLCDRSGVKWGPKGLFLTSVTRWQLRDLGNKAMPQRERWCC